MHYSLPCFPVLHYLLEFLKFLSVESVMPSNHLIVCHPLLLLPSVFPSIRIFPTESALCIRWLKYWSFSISPSNEYSGWFPLGFSGLISLQSKGLSSVFSSTVWKQQFFGGTLPSLQLSHLYMTSGKTVAFGSTDLCWQSDTSAF